MTTCAFLTPEGHASLQLILLRRLTISEPTCPEDDGDDADDDIDDDDDENP